ncbi:hypothetical protein VP01_148g24 [Puccinia sorghi]|uniref:Uncharacterized protein n=1 Tax=Puccinia sorghi TaxID=27349 RepID=A0A0L6VK11_9BASI|nr:hypothetical protein VP01_148g24 [Puccinia sorghi]
MATRQRLLIVMVAMRYKEQVIPARLTSSHSSSRFLRLGILVVTWFLCRQTYFDLSAFNLRSQFCSIIENVILKPLGLEPMDGFSNVSLKWTCLTILGTAAVQIVVRTWFYVKEELQSFWTEI